jgi:hypothetical protein
MRGHPPRVRQPRRLRHASFGLVILLVIQYVLGLSYNL